MLKCMVRKVRKKAYQGIKRERKTMIRRWIRSKILLVKLYLLAQRISLVRVQLGHHLALLYKLEPVTPSDESE